MPKLAVLVSGAGSILKAILDYPLPVDMVIADRVCPALEIAWDAGIMTHEVYRRFGKTFDQRAREDFSIKVMEILGGYEEGDVAAMAGFGTILSPIFFSFYRGKLLNTHPSLLPAFKGHRAVRQALQAGVSETGCSVHEAGPGVDEGRLLAQVKVPVEKNDTEASLHESIKVVERVLYPQVIAKVLAGAL